MTATTAPAAAGCPFAAAAAARTPTGCPVSPQAAAFDPFEPAYLQAPADYLRWARAQEPVFWSPQLGYWVVTRYDDVKAVFRDNLLFSPSVALEKITPASPQVMEVLQSYGYAMSRTMVNEDEPDHMARRRLLVDAFLPERLATLEPMVRRLARSYMDRFVERGRADLVQDMFFEIPLTVALKFLGVPDEGVEELKQFAVAHTLNTWGRPSPEEQVRVAHQVGRFWQTAQRILERMMAEPDGEGWMYESIRQHRLHPEVVPESYLRSMMMAILAAAHETTSLTTTNTFHTLLSRPQVWRSLCDNPELIPNAVEECLRVGGSIIAWRRMATADTEVGGVRIPKGAKLLLVQASANFDERHFERPDEIDIYRENAVDHMSFGYGAHQCMGKNIARLQIRVFVEEFVRRLPHLKLVPEQDLAYLPNTSFRGPMALWVQWDPLRNPQVAEPVATQPFYVGPPLKDKITRTLVVQSRDAEGEGLVRLRLVDPQGGPLPSWSAGAHVDLLAGGFRRKYSLCGPVGAPYLQVVIQHEAQGRGGSRYFCEQLAPGASVQLAGPKNLFKLDESAEHYELVAAGIGITPILAMADRLQALGKSYTLHYCGRDRAHMALLPRAEQTHGARLRLYTQGVDGTGRADFAQLLQQVDGSQRVYACGPDRLIAALEALAQQWQWPPQVLHFEHFSAQTSSLDPSRESGFVAELRDSQIMVQVGAGQTLLEALQAAGVDVPCDCNEGLCGTCEVQVLEGEIDHRDKVLSQGERTAQQRMMSCCSRAQSDKVVLAL